MVLQNNGVVSLANRPYQDGELLHFEVFLDYAQKRVVVYVNGTKYRDSSYGVSYFRSIRFSLGVVISGKPPDHTTNVGVDNIIVADHVVPKPALLVAVDIKPGSCPNPVNTKSSGVLPVAILGSNDYDITTIDPISVRLAGVEPLRSGYEDVATPVGDVNDCNCTQDGPDGFLDLTLKFKTQLIVDAIGDVNDGDILTLPLTGILYDPIPYETPIEGSDCILIKGKHRANNKADINKDGKVDYVDFAIITENWLQSIDD
jgi:hypothetical protein